MNAFRRHSLILATGPNGELGNKGGLPWPHLPSDLKFFTKLTTGRTRNAVVMGRKTWESLPPAHRPLKKRLNIVLSCNPRARELYHIPDTVVVIRSFAEIEAWMKGIDQCFICGGAALYQQSFKSTYLATVYHTEITPTNGQPLEADVRFEVDDYVEDDEEKLQESVIEKGFVLDFKMYNFERFVVSDESQYIQLVRNILESGVTRDDRTEVGTISQFGAQMRFNLRNGTMPLLTTKNTFWRGVATELLWFISGSTNANELSANGVHIWNANGSRAFLDQRGLTEREEGDLGPVYGFQWRHFGAKYVDMHTDYTGQGVDQLAQVIHLIKTKPTSRRIVMSAWNPSDLDQMVLPPCHMFVQFYVHNGELSAQLYQRSADMGLGVPFNIASYALLTHLVAHCCGLKAGDLVHTIGDAHIYQNHVTALQRQLERQPFDFPTLTIRAKTANIDEITYRDLLLRNYVCLPTIPMEMAV